MECFGEQNASKDEFIANRAKFFSYLYGSTTQETMSSLRYKLFTSSKGTPPIKTLPPTDDALAQHCLRCHLQVLYWKSALEQEEPSVNITDWGWEYDDGNLHPRKGVTDVAPPQLLKVVACSCAAENKCHRITCSCNSAGISCTPYCKCHGDVSCHNQYTVHDRNIEVESDDNDESENEDDEEDMDM